MHLTGSIINRAEYLDILYFVNFAVCDGILVGGLSGYGGGEVPCVVGRPWMAHASHCARLHLRYSYIHDLYYTWILR